jgi:hypothetical protein
MSRIEETCRHCSKTYMTYWPEDYQEFCCLGCRVDYYNSTVKEYDKVAIAYEDN